MESGWGPMEMLDKSSKWGVPRKGEARLGQELGGAQPGSVSKHGACVPGHKWAEDRVRLCRETNAAVKAAPSP